MRNFMADEIKPAVELLVSGNILPDRKQLILPFRAVNLSAVEVRVVKIYEKNVLSFLQENDLDGSSSLRRSGRLVYHGDIPLQEGEHVLFIDLDHTNFHGAQVRGAEGEDELLLVGQDVAAHQEFHGGLDLIGHEVAHEVFSQGVAVGILHKTSSKRIRST